MESKAPELSLEERLRAAAPPAWLVEMQQHYATTGVLRPVDLRRLLGDPMRRVEVGPQPNLSAFLGTG